MAKNKQKANWILDIILLLLFFILFFMDLTGVAIHQWLGVGLGILIVIHLVNHMEWVECILSKFFGKTSNRARVYAVVDLLLLLGLVLIIESGLVISTWLNWSWINYEAWWEIHIYSAVITLALTVLKIGIHRSWIICATKKIFAKRQVKPLPVMVAKNSDLVSRRQFLAGMGVISIGSALAISRVLPRNLDAQVSAASGSGTDETQVDQAIETAQPEAAVAQVEPTQTAPVSTQADPTQSAQVNTEVAVQEVQPTATAIPTEQATAASDPVASASTLVCTRSCRKGKHCAYPGSCHDYTDQNGNGLCDLGECA